MKLGMIGLGKMGNAIACRVLQGGYEVVGFDADQEASIAAKNMDVKIALSIEQVAQNTRIIWLMVPAGEIVDNIIAKLLPHLQKNDIIIDGGNSHFKDSIRRAQKLKKYGVFFLDCGVSGGLQGRDIGFSLMVGGEKTAYKKIVPVLQVIAAKDGFGHIGQSGAGHYVKMIHNGIEYGILQAYAEGFHVLKEGRYKDLDLEQIAQIWMHGAVIRSWILELARDIFKEDQDFKKIAGEIEEGGTGTWTVEEAESQHMILPVIEIACKVRAWSRETGGNYATKLVALLRNKFGGHPLVEK